MTGKESRSDAPCALCGRHKPLTFHHLIPRICHINTPKALLAHEKVF